jgi:hypothetical protein
MSRTRSGADLIDDALKRADVEAATDRHPRSEVLRYVNQGRTELVDILMGVNGRAFFRSATPWTITTTKDTTFYTTGYPADFYKALSVRVQDANGRFGEPLDELQPQEEPWLLEPETEGWPTHYEIRPNGIAVLPEHDPNLRVVVEYARVPDDITDSSSSPLDGVNGWEEYLVEFAARCIAKKDEEYELAADCEKEMMRLHDRIKKAAKRDGFRPKRVQDVRGPRMALIRGRWWGR